VSMHLARGLSTTSTRKRKETLTKAEMADLERGWRDRNQRLKEMYLPKETFEQYLEWVYGRGKKTKAQEKSISKIKTASTKVSSEVGISRETKQPSNHRSGSIQTSSENDNSQVSENNSSASCIAPKQDRLWVTGPCTVKQTPTYTGTKIIGIGTMHKSNAVPIFSDEEAKEISSMRR